jgi:hypothetical protein
MTVSERDTDKQKGPGNPRPFRSACASAYCGEEPPDVLVDPVAPVEPIDPVELDDDEPLLCDERPERDEVPVVLPPELVDDIEPLPVPPIAPEPIEPPLLIEPEPVEPIEPAPIDPPLLDIPAPEAPAEPEPPAAPDAPAPPPAAPPPPPPACAITATGANAMAAAMITNLRMFLSCYVWPINQSVPDWFL